MKNLNTELLNAELLNIELSDTELPDTELPDTELPDAELPDTELPDAELADTELPDTELPDTELPDTELPDTELPDTGLRHTGLLKIIHGGNYPLTDAAKTTFMLRGIIAITGIGKFLGGYNAYRKEHNISPVKEATVHRYSSMGRGYENGSPPSILVYARYLMGEQNLEFANIEGENFFTAPLEEVIAKLSGLPQGAWRSARAGNIILPTVKNS